MPFDPTAASTPDPHAASASTLQALPEAQHPPPRNPAREQPLPDPRTITDWPSGLRHITKLAARNAELGDRIKKASLMHRTQVLRDADLICSSSKTNIRTSDNGTDAPVDNEVI